LKSSWSSCIRLVDPEIVFCAQLTLPSSKFNDLMAADFVLMDDDGEVVIEFRDTEISDDAAAKESNNGEDGVAKTPSKRKVAKPKAAPKRKRQPAPKQAGKKAGKARRKSKKAAESESDMEMDLGDDEPDEPSSPSEVSEDDLLM